MTHCVPGQFNIINEWLHLKPWKPSDSRMTYSKDRKKSKQMKQLVNTEIYIYSKIAFKDESKIQILLDKEWKTLLLVHLPYKKIQGLIQAIGNYVRTYFDHKKFKKKKR